MCNVSQELFLVLNVQLATIPFQPVIQAVNLVAKHVLIQTVQSAMVVVIAHLLLELAIYAKLAGLLITLAQRGVSK